MKTYENVQKSFVKSYPTSQIFIIVVVNKIVRGAFKILFLLEYFC